MVLMLRIDVNKFRKHGSFKGPFFQGLSRQ